MRCQVLDIEYRIPALLLYKEKESATSFPAIDGERVHTEIAIQTPSAVVWEMTPDLRFVRFHYLADHLH